MESRDIEESAAKRNRGMQHYLDRFAQTKHRLEGRHKVALSLEPSMGAGFGLRARVCYFSAFAVCVTSALCLVQRQASGQASPFPLLYVRSYMGRCLEYTPKPKAGTQVYLGDCRQAAEQQVGVEEFHAACFAARRAAFDDNKGADILIWNGNSLEALSAGTGAPKR